MLLVRIWDVQHGSAAYIKTPNGTHIVQDLGFGTIKGGASTFSPLWHLKNKMGVSQLDQVIMTHPHRDHIDDITNFDILSPRVLLRPKHLTEKEILAANRVEDKEIVHKYIEINNMYNQPVPANENPLSPENNGDVVFETFVPKQCPRTNINNHSIVTVLSHASSKVLIPGDNEPESWDELLATEQFKKAIKGTDVLVAAHHGRESGYYAELFEHFTPKIVVVSDGRFSDTSATSRYSSVASGWIIHSRSGQDETRKCLTTRADGDIVIKIGINESDNNPFLSITVD